MSVLLFNLPDLTPIVQRAISVGGGAAHLDLVTIAGKVVRIDVQLNKPGHVKVANGPLSRVDTDLDSGAHSLSVALGDQWSMDVDGAVVELTVRCP